VHDKRPQIVKFINFDPGGGSQLTGTQTHPCGLLAILQGNGKIHQRNYFNKKLFLAMSCSVNLCRRHLLHNFNLLMKKTKSEVVYSEVEFNLMLRNLEFS